MLSPLNVGDTQAGAGREPAPAFACPEAREFTLGTAQVLALSGDTYLVIISSRTVKKRHTRCKAGSQSQGTLVVSPATSASTSVLRAYADQPGGSTSSS